MSVGSVAISGFTSFREVQWKPERLNVLIGPNGSGKSNLLRALELLRASAAGNLDDFILNNGGLPRLLWGGISRQIEFMMSPRAAFGSPSASSLCYSLLLDSVSQSAGFRVSSESLQFSDQPAPKDRLLFRTDDGFMVIGERTPTPARWLPEKETALSMVSALWTHPTPYMFQQQLRAWAIHHNLHVDADAQIRRPAVVREEKRVATDGQNLIPVLKTLYCGDFKDAIDAGMTAAFPNDYRELLFRHTEPDRVQLYIRRKHGAREDSAADLSDGTMRFLLLLAILAAPDPAPLIAIDEPESGLHPSMLPIIAEFAAQAATRTQVILSTHSPQMLDAFGDDPPTATVFSWVEDHTELKTITGDELKKWVAEYSLGRFIFSGEAAAVL